MARTRLLLQKAAKELEEAGEPHAAAALFLAMDLPDRAWSVYLNAGLHAEAAVLCDLWTLPVDPRRRNVHEAAADHFERAGCASCAAAHRAICLL